MLEDHRQGLASLYTGSFTTWQAAAPSEVIWSKEESVHFCQVVFHFWLFIFASDLILGVLAECWAEQRAWPDICSVEEAARGNKPSVSFSEQYCLGFTWHSWWYSPHVCMLVGGRKPEWKNIWLFVVWFFWIPNDSSRVRECVSGW